MKRFLAVMILCLSTIWFNSFLAKSAVTMAVTSGDGGIPQSNYHGTLADGTVLGFYKNSSYVYFTGAVSSVKSISVPDSIITDGKTRAVIYMGYNSKCDFSQAKTVTELTLPATITSIQILPEDITTLHLNSKPDFYRQKECPKLTKVLVPSAMLSSFLSDGNWWKYVLINAEGTQPLTLKINVTTPGEFAQLLLTHTKEWMTVNNLTVTGKLNDVDMSNFGRLKQLVSLDLSGASINSIPDGFNGSSGLSDNRSGFPILKDLRLPDVQSIGNYAFSECNRLSNVTLGKVSSIGDGAFAFAGFTKIVLPEGLKEIGNYAFYKTNLENIAIPEGVTVINDNCFSESALTSISIPVSVGEIKYHAFYQCSSLKSISLPSVRTIRDRAFYNCTSLESVEFSDSLTRMEGSPFSECKALTSVVLPQNLREVTGTAFSQCYGIRSLTSLATIPPSGSTYDILYGCDKTNVTLYVPANSVADYRAARGWNEFYTIKPTDTKTSHADIYSSLTVTDPSAFTADCDVTLSYKNEQYGRLTYDGTATWSMGTFLRFQNMGNGSYQDPYHYSIKGTSLVANGPMRADAVNTTLLFPNSYTWYFVTLPYDVKFSAIGCYHKDGNAEFVVRAYSGANRASGNGSTWVNLTADSTLHARQGYIVRCSKENTTLTFPGLNNANKNLTFATGDVSLPLGEYLSEFEHNRSWNLSGNPYPCWYDTRFLDFTAPITVWNRYNQRYDAYSPIDDSFILAPNDAFFVQRPLDKSALTFDSEGRQTTSNVRNLSAAAAVPRRAVSSDADSRKVFNLTLADEQGRTDRTRFVFNPDADASYDLSRDASKMFYGEKSEYPLLYTVASGVRYAIKERPALDGMVQVGFYAPSDGTYTLTVQTPVAYPECIMVEDADTGKITPLGSGYVFRATAGYSDSRITLRVIDASGVDNVAADGMEATVTLTDGGVCAPVPYRVYTLDGRMVARAEAGTVTQLSAGLYVVEADGECVKIVVR